MKEMAVLSVLFAVFVMFATLTYGYTSPSFTAYKPFEVAVQFTPSTLKVTSLYLGYNPQTDRYDNLTLTILNEGSENANVTVYTVFLNVENTTIAEGFKPVYGIQGKTLPLTISLNWTPDYTVKDVAYGKITIHQQPQGGGS